MGTKTIKRNVMITTSNNGVFAGKLVSYDQATRHAVITDARCCLYWPSECKGFLGLATVGPLVGSRVGPAAPRLELSEVTSVVDLTAVAAAAWESEPWS